MTYVLTSGYAQITIDGENFAVEPGDIVTAPSGTKRTLEGDTSLIIIEEKPT